MTVLESADSIRVTPYNFSVLLVGDSEFIEPGGTVVAELFSSGDPIGSGGKHIALGGYDGRVSPRRGPDEVSVDRGHDQKREEPSSLVHGIASADIVAQKMAVL